VKINEFIGALGEEYGKNDLYVAPVVLCIDHDFGGEFEVKEVHWNESEQRYEVRA